VHVWHTSETTTYIISSVARQYQVLLEAAFPPIEQNLPPFGENSPRFQIFLKLRYFSAIFGLSVKVNS
jgi:hypothetical protein